MSRCAAVVSCLLWSGVTAFLAPSLVVAQDTYYVRPDGGTAEQCDGLSNTPFVLDATAALPQSCAWDHPFRALPPRGTPRLAGGDTLIVDAGSYPMGLGAPGAEACSPGDPEACHMPPVPAGLSAEVPTRIVGAGWDAGCGALPELWGTGGADLVLNLRGSSNVEVRCLRITDHATCAAEHPKAALRCEPEGGLTEEWASVGVAGTDARFVTLRDLAVHGLASAGIDGGPGGWSVDNVRVSANGRIGWRGEEPASARDADGDEQTVSLSRVVAQWNGCVESWPSGKAVGCWSGPEDGAGDGLRAVQGAVRWSIVESIFSRNTGDGVDLQSPEAGSMVEIRRSLASDNAAVQLRVGGSALLENSIVVGNCSFFEGKPFTTQVASCASRGDAMQIFPGPGDATQLVNNTVTGEGDCLLRAVCPATATGSEVVRLRNDLLQLQWSFADSQRQTCVAAADGCATTPYDIDYAVIGGPIPEECPGANSVCTTDAGLANPSLDRFDARLQYYSPALDSGLPVGPVIPDVDFVGDTRPFGAAVDRGALERGLDQRSREEQVCAREVRGQLLAFVDVKLAAYEHCVDGVNAGKADGPCPDPKTARADERAVAKIDADRLARKCPGQVLPILLFGGPCAEAVEPASLATCLIREADAAVTAVLSSEYVRPNDRLSAVDEQVCQAAVRAVTGKPYVSKRFRALRACLSARDKGRTEVCPDAKATAKIERLRAVMLPRLERKCTNETVLALQALGPFAGPCADAQTVPGLLACLADRHDRSVDALLGILR